MIKPKRTWHKGAPPSVGWWPACHSHKGKRNIRIIRWWNGEYWSVAAFPEFTAEEANDCTCFKALGQNLIEWTDRWWE
jgi:hypothetical protein